MKLFDRLFHRSWIPFIERIFFTGLATILPITLTIFIFTFALNLFKKWLSPLHHYLPQMLQCIPYSEFLFALVIILTIGCIIDVLVLDKIITNLEKLVEKVPLVNPVYTGFKQLVGAFAKNEKSSLNQVVLIEFPRPGLYSVGFLTGETNRLYLKNQDKHFVSVFIPTTPNPTTGFYIMARTEDLHFVDLTKQEAMALIISGGIIQPKEKVPDQSKI